MTRRNLFIAVLIVAGIAALISTFAMPSDKERTVTSITMADLPGGPFVMGLKADEEHEQQSYPAQNMILKPFRIAKTVVTFDQYDAFARATGQAMPQDEGMGRGTRPVINVDRQEILSFIAWLNADTGHHFRLPSEAEWEYAGRGGTTTPYYWGSAISSDYANLSVTKGRDHFIATAPVKSFLPNGFGLFDMVGNVWQVVEDCRHHDLVGMPLDGRPWVDSPCDSRIARGGWYGSLTRGSRVTARAAVADSFRSMGLGFRLAEDAPGP
jgi:formylglycine-generating enzyme required for sulfatase activity